MYKSSDCFLKAPFSLPLKATLIAILLIFSIHQSKAQLNISGPQTVSQGTSYSYYPTLNGSGTAFNYGTYSYTISGGYVTGNPGQTYKSATCNNCIYYSLSISVTWTSSSGSLTFVNSSGNKILYVTAISALNAGTISPSSQTINYNAVPSTISGTAASGGAASPVYSYQWMVSADNVNWTNISGATSQNYSPGALTSSTYYRRKVTETTTNTIAYTTSVFVTVLPQLVVSIAPLSQTINAGNTPGSFSATVTGGNGNYSYQWQSSPNNSTWSTVASTQNYTPPAITSTTYYRLIVTSNGASLTSSTATVTVSAYPTALLSIVSTTPSGNGSVNLLGCTAGGGVGGYAYTWYSSTNGGVSYTPISNSSSSYTTPVITQSTRFYVSVSSGGLTTNSNIIDIAMPSPPTISSSAAAICNSAPVTLTATGGTGSYTWKKGNNITVGTGNNLTTNTPDTYYAVSNNAFGISPASNSIVLASSSAPTAGAISGPTICLKGSTIKLTNSVSGGIWSSLNQGIASVISSTGVITGKAEGTATIKYEINNSCGTSFQTVVISINKAADVYKTLGKGVEDPLQIDTLPLIVNTTKSVEYRHDTLLSPAHSIRNVVALRLNEETTRFIPDSFTATVNLNIYFGHDSLNLDSITNVNLSVTYSKTEGIKYNALNYIWFRNAEFVRVKIIGITAPVTLNGQSFDTKQVLMLTNTLEASRYYTISDNKRPTILFSNQGSSSQKDEIGLSWQFPEQSNHNAAQLEWVWLEDEMDGIFRTGSGFDTSLLFRMNSSRVDLNGAAISGSYAIPLLYSGSGKIFARVRGVSNLPSGTRLDGPWSAVNLYAFSGHADSLNWQSTTTYAEDGKRKTVIQYYDGSLRARQTVTKDNVTKSTIVAETIYDGQGRPAIQILPAPGISNIISYTRNLNLFNSQATNTDPLEYFDFSTPSLGNYATTALNDSFGTSRYYSTKNADLGSSLIAKNIPQANGYPYTVTRYTPDATGRIMRQSGVGDSLKMGSGHETRYFYGSPTQEELDALFGTEVGNFTHYFKNMVQDGNGQMSVSYVDMHGRTIATALAGGSPAGLQALNITNNTYYPDQSGKWVTQNLLDRGLNVLKEKSIESISSILVPQSGKYKINYSLPKTRLDLPTCSGGTVSYYCKFDLQIAVTDEAGDLPARIINFKAIDTVNIDSTFDLIPGSYSFRKTLTINQDSLNKFLQLYNVEGVGICRTLQYLTDSIAAVDSTVSGCGLPAGILTTKNCLDSLGSYAAFKYRFALSIGISDTTLLSIEQQREIRLQYISDSSFCTSLNPATSRTLDRLRDQMLLDFVPFTGQYARDNAVDASALKFNIFSTGGSSQPFFKNPVNALKQADFYYTNTGQPDENVSSTQLSLMTKETFAGMFSSSWATSLFPYHPEYDKWKYASDNLRPAYNFIDSINQPDIPAFNPITTDPFFTLFSTGKDKDSIIRYSNVSWRGNNSIWRMAYAEALGCKVYIDTTLRKNCYANMPTSFTSTGSIVNNGVANVTLTSGLQAQAWSFYKAAYTQERAEMVNNYIHVAKGSPHNAELVTNKYRIYFPINNFQSAQNQGWTNWYPAPGGQVPAVNLTDSVSAYTNYCDSYIATWRNTILQCQEITSLLNATQQESLLATLTSRLTQVCNNGKDAGNPMGASTVSPPNSSAQYKNFEDVVFDVLATYNIPKGLLCNPYSIQAPRPWGLNPPLAANTVFSIDSCNCAQFSKIKYEANLWSYDSSSIVGVNNYLRSNYQDTLTATLYNIFKTNCGKKYIYNCRLVGQQLVCDTLKAYPLPTPQPLPRFMVCGYVNVKTCYHCADFRALDSNFYTKMGRHIDFSGNPSIDSVLQWNALYARYLNFKTGLNKDWIFYSNWFTSTGCVLQSGTGNGHPQPLCVSFSPVYDTTGFMPPAETPCSLVRIRAQFNALNIYEIARQQAMANFQKAYLEKCLTVSETFKLTDTIKEYHYTLYYYDLAGNLVRTVPPNGVRPVYRRGFLDSVALARKNGTEKTPIHTFVTRYCYNSLNQVTLQRTPDAGTSQFWYDRLGRLAISQNAKQKGDIDLYSYTNYDSLGRITEVGQIRSSTQMTEALAGSAVDLGSWFSAASSKRAQITRTIYDIPFYAFEGESIGQRNLRNRVSYTQVIDTISNILARNSTYYSYDIHGNVDTLMQDFGSNQYFASAMNAANRFKRIVYDYDLISGKVNQVSYQPNRWDAYYHRYSYDGENRLVEVLSGRDSVMLRHFPEREARYNYYKHGPLGRTVIGQLQVQGLDYVYTLQGWLKGVNPVMGGTMRNGTDSVEAYPVAQDAYGFSLHYFKDDYRAIGHLPAGTSVLGALGAAARPLYNGNIASMVVNLPRFGSANVYNYSYDQLNRLTGMDAYSGMNGTAGTFVPQLQDAYRERVSYDPNGNILTYLRRGDNSRKNMDSLFYHYTAGTNKLHKVLDQAPDISGGAYTQYNDLRQNQTDNNYSYDSIGNLTQDLKDTISNISWTVYGKIRKIVKNGNIIEYAYDASGNRIMKKSTEGTYFYVRDASGNVMAVYKEQTAGTVTLEETHLYGSSRLGIAMAHGQADLGINIPKDYDTAKIVIFTRGEKFFELSNHLGNVLVTVSDKRLQFTQNGTEVSHYRADITSANDYYPFGMLMPGRKYSSGKYRYGFNGKENDNEIYTQDYGLRIYDPRLGRFLSVDPLYKEYPWYTPYQFAGNKPIQSVDVDGAEENSASTYVYKLPVLSLQKKDPIQEKVNAIRKQYNKIIWDARSIGANVAADNLQQFLNGSGTNRVLAASWIRSFGSISNGEDRIKGYYAERNVPDWASGMQEGQSITKSDHWVADISNYSPFSELSYASGASKIRASGSFNLSKKGDNIAVSGTVTMNWNDPYDWHAGLDFYIPGTGSISDNDALFVQEHGGAKPFEMQSAWSYTFSGTYNSKTGDWSDVKWTYNGQVAPSSSRGKVTQSNQQSSSMRDNRREYRIDRDQRRTRENTRRD